MYAQNSIDINFLYQLIDVIQELDSKQRKIRSFRGFFLYGLEIMEMGENYEILKTNLQPFFWRKVKTIIRQNKKAALQEFLFGSQDSIAAPEIQNHLNEKIESLENQVNSLQDRISELETKLTFEENSKYALRRTRMDENTSFTAQQGDYTLEGKKAPYLTENDPKRRSEIRDSTSRGNDIESKTVLEAPRSPLKPLSGSQEYNISSASQIPKFKTISANQEKAQNHLNFITLGKISEEEKIEIIQRGFQLQAEGKISLKKYYESTDSNSLFQLKGYQIKYETIRRTKLYQQLKPSNN